MNDVTSASLAQALISDKFLINFNNLVSNPMRTGIQRVCYEFSTRWPYIDDTIAFVELGMDRIGILDPDFFESVRQLFEDNDDVLRALSSEFADLGIDPSPGWIGLLSARNRIICEISVEQALECCRAVISLEESLNLEFFSLAAATRPEKIFNLCHDFLSWTHSEFFSTDWRVADNISLSLANRRKYTHNIFTSTTTRDVFVNRINRGDRRPYRVIAPGADGLGRTYRKTAPGSFEFLVVGTLEPRKQSLHILRAFERLQARGHDARLCFAGRMGWLEPSDKAELEAAFERYSWLRWVDSPADDELRDLMMHCRASIYMSVAEGFGSPPVESLALGVPCIVTADLPSILDLAPGGQLRVEARDGQGLEDAVRRLLDDDAVLALQAEIETLELPTWQSFVDGIAALVTEKVGAPERSGAATSYRARLGILASLSLLRQFDREELVEHLVSSAIPGIGEDEMTQWLVRAERADWSNTEVALNLMAAFPEALPARLVNDAVTGNLETTAYIPPSFAKEWRARFRRLLQIPAYPAFHEAIYTDLLFRNPGPGEVDACMPFDERVTLRTTYLRGAINSEEYRARLEAGLRRRFPTGYADKISLPTIDWKLRVIEQLDSEAAVDRALLIDEDDEFLDAASLDLTGQVPSREGRARLQALLKGRHGRERALLRLLLSEAGLRRVKDPQAHLELIRTFALRAGLAMRQCADERTIAGKVNAVVALPGAGLAAGAAAFLGREATPTELLLADFGQKPASVKPGGADLLAARLVLYATLRGEIVLSPAFVGWAAERLAGSPDSDRSDAGQGRLTSSPETAFAVRFGRDPDVREAAVLTAAGAQGLDLADIVDAVRIAALRADQVRDILPELAHFAQDHVRFVERFGPLDGLSDALLSAAPEQRRKAWRRSTPQTAPNAQHVAPPPVLQAFGHTPRSEGDILTVDQLMALDGEDFVRMAYRKLLLREADEGGVQTYLKALGAGRSKAAIIYSLSLSAEGRAADANLVGLDGLVSRQRAMRRWPVRKMLQMAGVPL
ncbi:hypothetical protein NX02_24825 [Sphingomonas sanxanigenens DSM 19645 = NX02]|uniref:DUF4214 domain-containing protein n=2 Tax=Sphingomonas sanxanigenens TaxID=397260 RepID=W0AJ53_9SPHN|nr:hypothetical protein NX02_24825 [Sphingomonas sanxanigenens DSM 19645 = NX02]